MDHLSRFESCPNAEASILAEGRILSVALTATIHNFDIDLADVDRGVYEQLTLRVARQPSETLEYMLMRVFAYCFEYGEGILFTEGVAAGDEPAVLIRDLTGKTTAWIEVGMPDPGRLHRGLKLAGRAAIYTHRDARKLLKDLAAAEIPRLSDIPVYAFDRSMIEEIAGLLTRRNRLSLSLTERELYLDVDGRAFTSTIVEHRVA
jgi:uncharacterized protein YaeQ